MKLVIQPAKDNNTIRVVDIPIGQIFKGTIGTYTGYLQKIVTYKDDFCTLVTYLVAIADHDSPGHLFWNVCNPQTFEIEDYEPQVLSYEN